LTLQVPYIYQSRTDATILIRGTPTPIHRGSRTMGGSESTDPTATVGSSSAENGLGDISLSASFTLLEETEMTPRILIQLYAKLPSTDEQKGLGTGEFGWGGGLGAGKEFGPWAGYAEALYILPGSSEVYLLDPCWEWLVSLSYRNGSGPRPGLALSGRSAPFEGTEDPLELKLRFSGPIGEQASYSYYVVRGLSEASPDWGIGIFGYLDF